MSGTDEASWSERALNAAAGLLRDDAAPTLGSPDLRRLHAGWYRALYEVDEEARTVTGPSGATGLIRQPTPP
jgi:hypothetical protein